MSKILVATFLLLSFYQTSEALSLGGIMKMNWTASDFETGYKLVGDMAYSPPKTRAWGVENKWVSGRVPYEISSQLSATAHTNIKATMELISSKVNYCVKFVEKTSTDNSFVNIIPNGSGCYSFVGDIRQSNGQDLALDAQCQEDKSTIAHELMHALGFHHEQSRADRDSFIKIDYSKLPGQIDQYDKEIGQAYNTAYDYQSLMHYPATDGMYAINPLGALIPGSWGRDDADTPSQIDIVGIKDMYCGPVQKVCDSGYNGIDCSNQYFTCTEKGTFADPLYCYKYIFCTGAGSKPKGVTECGFSGDYELVFQAGTIKDDKGNEKKTFRCTISQLYTNILNCQMERPK